MTLIYLKKLYYIEANNNSFYAIKPHDEKNFCLADLCTHAACRLKGILCLYRRTVHSLQSALPKPEETGLRWEVLPGCL